MADSQVLFTAHRDSLVRYLVGIVGHADTARDLAQDVFVCVLSAETLPSTDDGRRSWIFSIARNIAIDHHRRQRHRRVEPLAVDPPTAMSSSAETIVIVREALAALDDAGRDVFLLREAAGLSYGEIAVVCRLTPDAVRSRLHRARLQLREYLQQPIRTQAARPLRAGLR